MGGLSFVLVPLPASASICFHLRLITSHVLTMELLEGINFNDSAKLEQQNVNSEDLARRSALVWMEMIFRDGLFHTDPHPGNLLVLADGTLGIIDCGMVDRLDETMRETVEDLIILERAIELTAKNSENAKSSTCGILTEEWTSSGR